MKNIFFFITLLLVFYSCNDNDTIAGKEVEIMFQSYSLGNKTLNTTPFQTLDLFAIDRDNNIIRHETFTRHHLQGNILPVTLPLGKYRLAFVANVLDQENLIFEMGKPLENILLHLPKKEDAFQESNDVLTAIQNVSISENSNTTPFIQLCRRVAQLQITINNIPENIHDLNIELSFVPSSINFTGSDTDVFGIISKKIEQDINGNGHVGLLTFPAKEGEAVLSITYYSENKIKYKNIPFTGSIDTNQIVNIQYYFSDLPEGNLHGNGKNLLHNGGFEQWTFRDGKPYDWKFYKDGKDSLALKVDETKARTGSQAAFLQGKTYLYQDIPVESLKRYEIKMHVNAPSIIFPWKYYCYWRKNKSTALPAENNKPIQAQAYLKQTNGWINVFHGKNFMAPLGSNYLRIEIRTYGKDILPEEGIYVDDFSVELVE